MHPLVQALRERQLRFHRIGIQADQPKASHLLGQNSRQSAVTAAEIQPTRRREAQASQFRDLGGAPHRRRRLKRIELEEPAQQPPVHQAARRGRSPGAPGRAGFPALAAMPPPVKLVPSSIADKPICTAIASSSSPNSVRRVKNDVRMPRS